MSGTGNLPTEHDLSKWMVQASQISTLNGDADSEQFGLETPTKNRLRRVACTCPNCKDVERGGTVDPTKRKVCFVLRTMVRVEKVWPWRGQGSTWKIILM